jgi:hypothetical protein
VKLLLLLLLLLLVFVGSLQNTGQTQLPAVWYALVPAMGPYARETYDSTYTQYLLTLLTLACRRFGISCNPTIPTFDAPPLRYIRGPASQRRTTLAPLWGLGWVVGYGVLVVPAILVDTGQQSSIVHSWMLLMLTREAMLMVHPVPLRQRDAYQKKRSCRDCNCRSGDPPPKR